MNTPLDQLKRFGGLPVGLERRFDIGMGVSVVLIETDTGREAKIYNSELNSEYSG